LGRSQIQKLRRNTQTITKKTKPTSPLMLTQKMVFSLKGIIKSTIRQLLEQLLKQPSKLARTFSVKMLKRKIVFKMDLRIESPQIHRKNMILTRIGILTNTLGSKRICLEEQARI